VAELRAGAGFAHADCADGWALAVGARGLGTGAALFHRKSDRWVEVRASPGITEVHRSGTPTPTALEYAGIGTGISPTLLQDLGRPYPAAIRREADAGALVEELATYESSIGASGSYQASSVITAHGKAWLVTEGADSAISNSPAANASPYPNGVVVVYRWMTRGWTEQGTVRGWFGPVGECCGILAESVTGSSDPDFALTGGGAADTNWLSVVSDAGGQWHAVRFNYGYSDTTVVNGEPKGRGIMTWVDATSSAFGPTTSLFETFQHGAFQPASPSGTSPPCTLSALQAAADPGPLMVLEFSKFACADGWAAAIGTGAGFNGQVVGLFEADGTKWRVIEIDNGDSLGSDPGIYDIPLTLLNQLTVGFGPGVQPALASAPLIAQTAMTGPGSVPDGVVTADGTGWFLAESATGSAESAGANVMIYRWSGSTWEEQGQVDQVPASLNEFQNFSATWFDAVAVPGATDPGFIMQGGSSATQAMITDAGGAWHVAPYVASG
jgi:hypothetical protein